MAGSAKASWLSVGQSKPGNVFLSTEVVEIPVQTDGDSIDWTIVDFFGAQTHGATVRIGRDGRAVIRPNLGRKGYFALHLSASSTGRAVAQADTSFAVIAPSEVASSDDSAFGVMTHFAQGWDTDLMPLIARAGLRHIRDEQYWQAVESTRGQFDFGPYKNYLAAASANGLDILTELTFGNALYDHDPTVPGTAFSPWTDDGRAGYANYGNALLDHYGGQIDTVEVWNEYNGTWCNGPAATDPPQYYEEMLQNVYPQIKTRHPGVRVLGGAAVLMPLPWFEDLFNDGALDYMDAVVIHPYRDVPEGVEKDVGALRDLTAVYNHGRGPKPIWATECGEPDPGSVGREGMARYLVRLLTLLRGAGVERVYWYLMRDYNEFSTGLVRSDQDPLGRYTPTAAYPAYANLIRMLRGASFVRREATDLRTRMYTFDRGGELRVAWSTAPTSQLILTAEAPLTLTNIMGEARVLRPANGEIALTVGKDPVYLQGTVTAIRETGGDTLLADAVDGFSGSQGAQPGGWTYGFYDGDPAGYKPGAFRPMTWTRNPWGYCWQCPYGFASIQMSHAHPSVNGAKPVWVVRRWRSNAAGNVRVTGSARRATGAGGDGTGIKVLIDGVEAFSEIAGGPGRAETVRFDLPVTLKSDGLVDFAVTPGPGANIDFDDVSFTAQISRR